MEDIEIARWLYGRERKEARAASPGRTTTYTATAASGSEGGWVDVAMEGDVHTGDGTNRVRMPCDPAVRAGDVVEVSIVGGSPRVTGVVGGGDRLAAAAAEASEVAARAQAAAQEAADASSAAQAASEAAQRAAGESAQAADAAVASVETEYATGATATDAPASGWSTAQPAWEAGGFVWVRTRTTTRAGVVATSAPACVTGPPGEGGDAGVGVAALATQYYLSSSPDAQTGGEWSATMPGWSSGHWVWTRQQVTWTSGETTRTDPVLAGAINTANENAQSAADAAVSMASHVWVDSSGRLHVSTQGKPESGDVDSGRHLLLTAAGIALSAGASPLLDMTGGTSGRIDLYDANGKRRLSVTAGGVVTWDADGTTATATLAADSTLGKVAGKHIVLSGANGVALMDGNAVLSSFTASAATVGQASGKHVSVTPGGIALMDGTATLASFTASGVLLGQNSTAAYVDFCAGLGSISYTSAGQISLSSAKGVVIRPVTRAAATSDGVGIVPTGSGSSASSQAIMTAGSYLIAGQALTHARLGAALASADNQARASQATWNAGAERRFGNATANSPQSGWVTPAIRRVWSGTLSSGQVSVDLSACDVVVLVFVDDNWRWGSVMVPIRGNGVTSTNAAQVPCMIMVSSGTSCYLRYSWFDVYTNKISFNRAATLNLIKGSAVDVSTDTTVSLRQVWGLRCY